MTTASTPLWIEEIPAGEGWTLLWNNKVLCRCGGIRAVDQNCSACDGPQYDLAPVKLTLTDGKTVEVQPSFMGAEGRYEDYLYLKMMEREWNRTVTPSSGMLEGVSEKASVVLLFWTYFETRVERILRIGLRGVPEILAKDTLDRYTSIGARVDKLYRILFGTTYGKDLEDVGHPSLWTHLKEVQKRRNDFTHGNPKAIDDEFAKEVVARIKEEHEAWIAVFNHRIRLTRSV